VGGKIVMSLWLGIELFFDKTGMWRFFRKKIVNYLRPKKQDKMIAVNGSNDAGNPAIPGSLKCVGGGQ